MNEDYILQAFNIEKTFIHKRAGQKAQKTAAIRNVSLNVRQSEILGLVGESGSGKTTLGKILIKLLQPTNGNIVFCGEDVTALNIRKYRPFRKKIQMIFQNPYAALNPGMTIRKIIEEPLKMLNQNGKSLDERLMDLMKQVNLNPAKLEQFPKHLSGGERRRVGIARILALNPDMIILDEPVAALDISIKKQIIDLLLSLHFKRKITFFWISHDLITIKYVADRIAIMYLGSIVEVLPKNKFDRLLHPYSIDLFASSQFLANQLNQIHIFDYGSKNGNDDRGCLYRNRCRLYHEKKKPAICEKQTPVLQEKDNNHLAACHFALGER